MYIFKTHPWIQIIQEFSLDGSDLDLGILLFAIQDQVIQVTFQKQTFKDGYIQITQALKRTTHLFFRINYYDESRLKV